MITALKRLTLGSLVLVTAVSGLLAVPLKSFAISGSDFQAGRIIDDSIFYNGNDMAPSTIQAFLNSKVPTCETNHAARSGNNPPFTCLKDYQQNTPSKPGVSGLCSDYTGGMKSAAQIIYDVGVACGVNQKVLIVLLEKEESLVTDTWPWDAQYQMATGYGCPDTAACDAEYAGFFNQVFNAAQQFKRYQRDSSSFRYRSGRDNYIQYNPNAGCGGTNVFIQSQATASLYNYTPYQPNASALSNLTGTGDSCAAYGNRNFWKLYTDWFGSTTSNSGANTLNFVRLNHYSGKVEVIGYPSIGSYGYSNRNTLVPYGSATSAVPVFRPNGDLSLVRLNDPYGRIVVTTFSASSNFQQLSSIIALPYPAVPADGTVIPMFRPNGDLSLVRLNDPYGKVVVTTFNYNGSFQQLSSVIAIPYPAVPADGAVIPMFRPNGDLSLIRLNHYSGKVEVVTYNYNGSFQQLSSIIFSSYPAVNPDGAVVPQFQPNGDLSFIRLNHYSGKAEAVTYSFGSYFGQMSSHVYTPYPSISDFSNVKSLISR